MISAELQQAIDSLQIQDVYLRWTKSECLAGFRPKYGDLSSLLLQHMHVVRQAEVFEVDGDGQLLQVLILLGARWVVPSKQEGGEPEVKALIEAEFIAEYRGAEGVAQACIDEFAQRNASFHVWPYWREYLAAQTERMRLPRVVVPTMQLPHHRAKTGTDAPDTAE